MARTTMVIDAGRQEIWAVLTDAWLFARWVVGAKTIRTADESWPSPGSKFHHTVGIGPLSLDDSSKSLAAEPPRRLVLEARARPFGRARVEIILTPVGEGTRVEMVETVTSPALARVFRPALAPLVRLRNQESLRRLGGLVNERARRDG